MDFNKIEALELTRLRAEELIHESEMADDDEAAYYAVLEAVKVWEIAAHEAHELIEELRKELRKKNT